MENAILHAGIEELNIMKEHVMELNGYQERNVELLKEETRLEKLISGKEEDCIEEVETTLKKRKSELASAYETQLGALNARNKKVKAKKEKHKGAKMTERIADETAELREENKGLLLEIKAKMKAEKTPRFCNTTLFYALFMPKTLKEFAVFILGLLIVFLAIPFGIYTFFFAEKFGEFTLAIIYVAMIVLVGSLYLAVNNKVKEKHLDTIREVRGIRMHYQQNLKQIREIRRGIKKDEDESLYGLEQYDEELVEIDEELKRVTEEEKEALNTFETVTAPQITAEIKSRYEQEINVLKEKYREVCDEQKKVEEKVKEFSLMLSKQYEAYLGKDVLTVQKLDKLIAHIEKGEASDIGEALSLERK